MRAISSAYLPLFLPAALAAQSIRVGENVHVSKDRARFAHGEVVLGADASGQRLIACATEYVPESERRLFMDAFLSDDGGRSWRIVSDSVRGGDPVCGIGANGTAFLIAGTGEGLKLTRSKDGGATWSALQTLPYTDSPDRHYMAMDQSPTSKYRGRMYVSSWGRQLTTKAGDEPLTSINLWWSRDSGQTWSSPIKRVSPPPRMLWPMSQIVVAADGAVMGTFGEFLDVKTSSRDCTGRPNAELKYIVSTNGGESFSDPVLISTLCMDMNQSTANSSSYTAVDVTTGPFRGRIYVAWTDRRTGHDEIMFSSSTDKGKTWSPPTVIEPAPRGKTRDNFMPRMAVNKDGVVGLVWSDRRESGDNLSYEQRFTASVDGGATWLPSVKVSSAPSSWDKNQPFAFLPYNGFGGRDAYMIDVHKFNFTGGDTGGIDVTADGTFHTLWVDNRTGLLQVWTAAINVDGRALANGDAALEKWKDVTDTLQLVLLDPTFDRASGLLTVLAKVKNTSKDTVRASQLKARLTQLASSFGTPVVVESDNGRNGPGALWDLTAELGGKPLAPDSVSAGGKRLKFRLENQIPLSQVQEFNRFFTLRIRLLRAPDKVVP